MSRSESKNSVRRMIKAVILVLFVAAQATNAFGIDRSEDVNTDYPIVYLDNKTETILHPVLVPAASDGSQSSAAYEISQASAPYEISKSSTDDASQPDTTFLEASQPATTFLEALQPATSFDASLSSAALDDLHSLSALDVSQASPAVEISPPAPNDVFHSPASFEIDASTTTLTPKLNDFQPKETLEESYTHHPQANGAPAALSAMQSHKLILIMINLMFFSHFLNSY